MQKETEIKLRVSRDTLAALRKHPLLNARLERDWTRHALLNQYYDTDQQALAQARVALRVRRDGDRYIQTLKSRGHSVAGLSERNEWDWYLEQPVLDVTRLSDDCWPASLADLDKHSLKPLFTTDFMREKADLLWSSAEGSEIRVEAALDLGSVKAAEREDELCELELELRQGEPVALLNLAIELAADLPLMPCDISKAERGYRLHEDRQHYSLPLPELDARDSLDEAVAKLFSHLLGNSQRLAEHYRFSGRWTLLVDWLQHLIDMRALLSSLGQAAPRQSTQALREHLDALLQDWRTRIQQGQQDDSQRQQAQEAFAAELCQTRWGLFSLLAARWLLQTEWTLARTARGTRQGAAPLSRWLPHLLGEEGQALRLAQYDHHPLSLLEQHPRMERLLVWLRLARKVLDLPETDRLYGELAKLHEMTGSSDDALAITAQIHTLWGLTPWKVLTR